jgi:hypothetical protein
MGHGRGARFNQYASEPGILPRRLIKMPMDAERNVHASSSGWDGYAGRADRTAAADKTEQQKTREIVMTVYLLKYTLLSPVHASLTNKPERLGAISP